MRENTKYHRYRFNGKINVDEIQPWFDFGTSKPWDDPEIPWVLDNKVKREILRILSMGPKTFEELYNELNFSPKPLLVTQEEYQPKIHYQWAKETIKNHLFNLEWYHLISLKEEKYELTFPFLKFDDLANLEQHANLLAEKWVKIILNSKQEFNRIIKKVGDSPELYSILIDKVVNSLYTELKVRGIIPDEPNIKVLWGEQLRKLNFEEWINQNF